MLSRGQSGREIMQMVWLEDLVPKDHLLREIDAAVKRFLYPRCIRRARNIHVQDMEVVSAFGSKKSRQSHTEAMVTARR